MTITRATCAAIAVAALLLIGAGCGDDDDDEPTVPVTLTPTQTSTDEPTPTGPVTPTEEPFSGDRDPVEKPEPAVPPAAIQIDTRFAEHTDFDRVVFDFEENSPGYRIEYVDPPILADGSGAEVEIEGEAFLQVTFLGAQAHDEAGNTTIDELEIMPDLPSIVEIERTGDFEGHLTWVFGLPEELDFNVTDLTDPTRVVVDVGHP